MTAMNGRGTVEGVSATVLRMVPNARHTPAGRPDVSDSQRRADNAKLLWLAVSETAASPLAQRRTLHGYGGFLWNGSVKKLCELMWHGLGGWNEESEDCLAAMLEFLSETVNLVRMPSARDWWIAYEWAPRGKREIPEPEPVTFPAELEIQAPEPVLMVEPVTMPLDPADAIRAVLDELTMLRVKCAHLEHAAQITGDHGQLQEEAVSLREQNAELRETVRLLRAEKEAFDKILGRR